MSELDPLVLSRIQFAANMSFHILFPSISIALCWVLLFFKMKHRMTAAPHWHELYQFWLKIFAITFALGVVSGITMSFQFGTNWPGFMQHVGNIAGPLLAYEVLTAFFMEATFLGIMLFGASRVGERIHLIATLLVAIGTTLSAFWILALNSWMHTPTGFEMRDGVAHATSWPAILFNPSLPYRLAHMLMASALTVAFLIAGISAYRLRRGDHSLAALSGLRTGVMLAAIVIPLQMLAGDLHGLNTLEHQPAKVAAMEGLWNTQRGVPAALFAIPDSTTHQNHFEIAIPKLASIYLTHSVEGEVKGINDFGYNHPPVAPLFFAFRIMVGIGLLMLLASWSAWWQMRKSPLPGKRILTLLQVMTFAGWIALLAGWYTTEIGRQPWLVYGVLSTADAVGPIPAAGVASSLLAYLCLYAALIAAYISVLFYMARKAASQQPAHPATESDNQWEYAQ